MKAGPIIARLRDQCASFSNRVAGVAEFDDALPHDESLAVPHAFVIVGFNSGLEAQTAGLVTQVLNDELSVVLCVDNTEDDRGQGGADNVEDLLDEVWSALIGWVPGTGYGGLQYQSGSLLAVSRARLWYVMEFTDSKIIGQS